MTFRFYDKYKLNTAYWFVSALLFGYILVHKFSHWTYIKKQIPYFTIRYYLGHLICFFPISCFSTGTISAINIFNNTDIQYVQTVKTDNKTSTVDSASTKFIGFIGDKLITASLDNKKIFISNQTSFDSVVLTKK